MDLDALGYPQVVAGPDRQEIRPDVPGLFSWRYANIVTMKTPETLNLKELADRLAIEAKRAGCRAVIIALSVEGEHEASGWRVTTAGSPLEVEGLAQRAVAVAARGWGATERQDSAEESRARAAAQHGAGGNPGNWSGGSSRGGAGGGAGGAGNVS